MISVKRSMLSIMGLIVLLVSGCATTTKIVVPAYSPPKEFNRLAEIESGGEVQEGAYIALAIDPEIKGKGNESGIGELVINSVKEGLTDTNFITLHPIFDDAYVQLNLNILAFDFTKAGSDIRADIQVAFTVTKGITEYLNKTYSAEVNRYSEDPNLLPSKNKVLFDLSKDVTKKFISDITPLKTFQLREFRAMPSGLEYILTYAKQGNYVSAVEDMEAYDGAKDAGFHYNLAILYEALGSQSVGTENFVKANKNYKQSMRMGGSSDEVIVNNKSRFDNFYRIFKMTEKQKKKNQGLTDRLEEDYGIGQ